MFETIQIDNVEVKQENIRLKEEVEMYRASDIKEKVTALFKGFLNE